MSYRRAIHQRSRFRASPPHIQGTAISLEVPRLGRPPSLPFEAMRFARLAKKSLCPIAAGAAAQESSRKRPCDPRDCGRGAVEIRRQQKEPQGYRDPTAPSPTGMRRPARSICAATAGRVPIGRVMSGHAPLWTTRLQVMRDAHPRAQSRAGTVAESIPAVPIPCAKPARSQPALRTRRRPETGHDRETLQGRRSVRASL